MVHNYVYVGMLCEPWLMIKLMESWLHLWNHALVHGQWGVIIFVDSGSW